MKYLWEEADIHSGLRVLNASMNEEWIVGYNVGCGPNRLALISLSDGMISSRNLSTAGMTDVLNVGNYMPVEVKNEKKVYK